MNFDDTPPPKSGKAKAGVLATLVVAALSGGFWAFVHFTRDVQEAPPRMLGSVWTAPVGGITRIFYVMEEERSEVGYFDTDMLHSYSLPYSIFTLHARNGKDGASATVCTLGRRDKGEAKNYKVTLHLIEKPEILGPQGPALWVWLDGLEARDLGTLATTMTMARIKEVNPELGKLLPAERKYYKVLGGLNALVFKGSDARFFRIDPGTGRIEALDEAKLGSMSREHSKTADMAFASLTPDSDSLWSTSESGLMWGSLIDQATSTWYGLLTAEEKVPSFWQHPRYSPGPNGEVARSLFRAKYTTEESRTTVDPHVKLDAASVAPLGTQRYLMGGFLRRPNADSVWLVGQAADEKSLLVLHRQALGENSPWHVTRVGLNGKVHWTRSTGLADLEHLSDGSGAVVLTGFADRSQPTAKRPDLLVFIDELSGEAKRFNLASNEEWKNSEKQVVKNE